MNKQEEEKVLQDVKKLRASLENAKAKLNEQNEMLQQLTSPPFAYATVVSLSQWAPNQAITSRRDSYPSIGSDRGISVERSITSQKGVRVGDTLKLVSNDVREEMIRAKEHVVVGFRDGGNEVVVQLDGYRAVRMDYPSRFKELYQVLGQAKKFGTAVVSLKGEFFEVLLPNNLEINPGDTVTIVAETMQIVDVASVQIGGDIAFLRRVIDEMFSEVDCQSSIRVVFNGKFGKQLEKGDRVVLDGTATVIVRNLGKEDERFSFAVETNVTWKDIGGLAAAKQQMIEAVELPHKNPDIFRFYGKRPVKGILLYGPPGCGKTMLGKATATALARIYNGGSKSAGFIYIKGPEILDRYVGVAEATIRQIFQRARKHKDMQGYPAVIFIDEADAILAKRGSGISSDVERTIVPMFLTEMDGLEDSGALVILATNRSDILDPAVVRDGRIDRKVKITRPTPESAAEIFLLNLKRVPLKNGFSRENLAKLGSDEVFAPRRALYQIQTKNDGVRCFTLGNIVNGGMIVSIVDQATSIALQRDLSKSKPEGLAKEDLVAAVSLVEQQNRDLNHADELADFVYDFREDVMGVQKLRQASA